MYTYTHIRLAGLAAALPATKISIADTLRTAPKDVAFKIQRTAALAGLSERYVTTENQYFSDLAIAAAQNLLTALQWDAQSIDALFIVTQTPDYILPSTGYLIHHALQCKKECVVTDIIASCSGFVQGLWLACGHIGATHAKRALVLVGDTSSKDIAEEDTGNVILFGDAVAAAALEFTDDLTPPLHFCFQSYPDVLFDLVAYGSGAKKEAGKKGFYMNGGRIVDFVNQEVLPDLRHFLQSIHKSPEEIDLFFTHQPNAMILNNIKKYFALRPEQLPIVIDKYGNCSSASIPLAMIDTLPHRTDPAHALLCGFGGGLTMAAMYTTLPGDMPCSLVMVTVQGSDF